MIHTEFEHLLKQVIGLDAASIGSSAIERAVEDRQSACKMKDPEAYWQHVHTSATELQELIEAVIVPETWFFRDNGAFAALARMVYEEWLPHHAEGTLQLLSLPCATGEEPYSMAMALLDAGLPANRFHIDAVDVSTRAIAQARRAIYGKNSFRGNDLGFRDRHFESTPHGYRPNDTVRQSVYFQQGNIFDTGFLPGVEIYDVIFCRNVLIYFDRATQGRAIKVLERLLSAKGLLFVAPSETGLLLSHDFVSAKMPMAFAFRKASAVPPKPKPAINHRAKHPTSIPWAAPSAPAFKPVPAKPVTPAVAPQPRPQTAPKNGIDEARRLADQGHLAEAAECCKEHLRVHGPSAQAFHLLGLVRDATGSLAEAVEFYRKALYLDPNQHETLAHLALLLEKQGDTAGAKVLNDRVRRLGQRNST